MTKEMEKCIDQYWDEDRDEGNLFLIEDKG